MGSLTKLILLLGILAATATDFTATCPDKCQCTWYNGKKQATCSNATLQTLPTSLSPEIQILDLTNNPLHQIKQRAFEEVQLINLQKLFLRNCELETIDKQGLSSLAIMVQLDLSRNNLKELHSETFKETTKIRCILLNHNQLETLNDGLFNNLSFLQKVDLSYNRIQHIGENTFKNVPNLTILKLNNNRIESLKMSVFGEFHGLTGLDLHDNPWKCSCYLAAFRNFLVMNNWYTTPVACAEPVELRGKLWEELVSTDFNCTSASFADPTDV